jgi:glycosyltransferase involved in cell wall biosynthesis
VAPVTRPVVLFVLQWSLRYVGGVNHVVTQLAQQMRAGGAFEPLVLMADWDAPAPVYEDIHGVRTVRWQLRARHHGMGVKARLAYALWERRFRKQFARFCQVHDVRAVNLHYPGDAAFTFARVLQSLRPRIPLLLSFHGTDASKLATLGMAEKDAWRRLIVGSDAVVTCSRELAQRLDGALATPVPHRIIYSGVDAARFARRAAPDATGKRVILHVGRFDRNKGQDVLLAAFARIADTFPDTVLHLVGDNDGNGSTLDSLRAQVTDLRIEARVRFFVSVPFDDMPAHFAQATAFAFPSRQEAFGLALLEAGAGALPVVAAQVGGIPELIEDGVTGLLVEPDNAPALAQALATLLEDPAAAQRLGERLAERIAAEFSWSATRMRYEELIRETGGKARGAA